MCVTNILAKVMVMEKHQIKKDICVVCEKHVVQKAKGKRVAMPVYKNTCVWSYRYKCRLLFGAFDDYR